MSLLTLLDGRIQWECFTCRVMYNMEPDTSYHTAADEGCETHSLSPYLQRLTIAIGAVTRRQLAGGSQLHVEQNV